MRDALPAVDLLLGRTQVTKKLDLLAHRSKNNLMHPDARSAS